MKSSYTQRLMIGSGFLVVMWAFACLFYLRWDATNSLNHKEEMLKKMINSVDISPWPNDKDAFVVVDVALVGDTRIRNVIVKRKGDNYLASALSSEDIPLGSVVKLAFLRKVNNSNGAYGAVPIIKEVIKEAKKTEKPN